jgi:3-hydroxy-9,10-secoandrosta-1,3,5(10)-triene-9,17-dione monooxygenase reductase component
MALAGERTHTVDRGSERDIRCRLVAEHPGGDHRILIGGIDEMFGPATAATPLLYHGGKYARLPYNEIDPFERIDEFWWTG